MGGLVGSATDLHEEVAMTARDERVASVGLVGELLEQVTQPGDVGCGDVECRDQHA
jgi:hypothetical protein